MSDNKAKKIAEEFLKSWPEECGLPFYCYMSGEDLTTLAKAFLVLHEEMRSAVILLERCEIAFATESPPPGICKRISDLRATQSPEKGEKE